MKGPGRLWIFDVRSEGGAKGTIAERAGSMLPQSAPSPSSTSTMASLRSIYDIQDGCYDVSWSEIQPQVLATALADGTVQLYSLAMPERPLCGWREHGREVGCVEWNSLQRDRLLSSSYDGTIKIWNGNASGGRSLLTMEGHKGHAYQASWSPREAFLFVSVGGDRAIRLWDERVRTGAIKTLPLAHDHEILSVDWNKWDSMQIATGSVDQSVRIWDWRMLATTGLASPRPLHSLLGHHRAIRKVRWSPFTSTRLVSAGYDMAVRVWDLSSLNPLIGTWEGHSEFVTGLDYSLHDPSVLLATCGWDQTIFLLKSQHCGIDVHSGRSM